MRTGGQIIIDQLEAEGVRHLFMVPGESFLPILDALNDCPSVLPIVTRNEAGAAIMAEATGKATGRPGVAIVTRGPGAANALCGVYIAARDQSPMILLVGLPRREYAGLPAFQDIDLQLVFGSLAKRVAIAESAETLGDLLQRAFVAATSGRPGAVVIGLPQDVLDESAESATVPCADRCAAAINEATLQELRGALLAAERPLIVAGGATWSREAAAALASFAEAFDVPVASAFRRQDRIDNRCKSYVGHLGFSRPDGLAAGMRAADLLIVFGQCLDEVTTHGFTLVNPDNAGQRIVLIAADAQEAEPPYHPAVAISAAPEVVACALSQLPAPDTAPSWRTWRRDLRMAYEESRKPVTASSRDGVGAGDGILHLAHVIERLADRLPDDTIVCNGAGQYAAILHRLFCYRAYPAQLAPVCGTMGYGLPAAISAKLAFPQRAVVALAGDGCFQMTAQELATAVQYALPIIIIIADNAELGTVRRAAEMRYARQSATSLVNPDFGCLARAMGASGMTARTLAEFDAALEASLAAAGPSVIELKCPLD